MNHTLLMLAIGNGIAIAMMFTLTPFLVDHTGSMIDRQYKWVNDEGDKKLDELRERFVIAIYVLPIAVINIVTLVIHFYFVNYENNLKRDLKRHDY